jgi:hypothetical protein
LRVAGGSILSPTQPQGREESIHDWVLVLEGRQRYPVNMLFGREKYEAPGVRRRPAFISAPVLSGGNAIEGYFALEGGPIVGKLL